MKKRILVTSYLMLVFCSVLSHASQPFSLEKTWVTPNRMEIELPYGKRLTFDVKSSTKAGISTIRGKQDDNQLLITTDGKNTFGSITTTQGSYRVDTTKEGVFIVAQAELYAGTIDDISTPVNARRLAEEIKKYRAENQNVNGASPSNVDIVLFFTPLLEEQLGIEGVRTKAKFLLDMANDALADSGIEVTLNVLFVTPFDESLGAEHDNDTNFDEHNGINGRAVQLSIKYGADLMHVLALLNGDSNCGQAGTILWINEDGSVEPSLPAEFPIWGISKIGGIGGCLDEITFPHEIGHNFNADHDRPALGGGTNRGYISDYNYGHHCGGRGTIMNVTLGGDRHRFFSSPDIIFEGEPCGVPIGQPDAADNVAVFEVTRSLVENVNPPMPVYGTASFAVDGYVVADDTSYLTITLRREGDLSKDASVELATLDGSAEADVDFGHFLKRVEFAAGSATTQVEIEIFNLQRTVDKDFRLVLRWPFQLAVSGSDVIEVKLAKNIVALGLAQFAASSKTVAENAGAVALTVSRVNGSDGEITVNYQTVDGTAKAGTDFTAKSGELVFLDGETSKSISITIINNSAVDGSRSFAVNLSGNNLGATASTNVTISDDDQTPPTDSGSSGGGGSLGLGLMLLAWLGFLYRVKKKCLCFLCPFYRSNQPA